MSHGGDHFTVKPGPGGGDTGTGGPNEPSPGTAFEPRPGLPTRSEPPEPTPSDTRFRRDPGGRRSTGGRTPLGGLPGFLDAVGRALRPGGRREEPLAFGEASETEADRGKRRLAENGAGGEQALQETAPEEEAPAGSPTLASPARVITEVRELLAGDRDRLSAAVTRSASLAGFGAAFLFGGAGG